MSGSAKHRRIQRGVLTSIIDGMLTSVDRRELMRNVTELVGQAFGVSRCLVCDFDAHTQLPGIPFEWSSSLPDSRYDELSVSISHQLQVLVAKSHSPLVIETLDEWSDDPKLVADCKALGVKSLLAIPAAFRGVTNGCLMLFHSSAEFRWSKEEVEQAKQLAYFLGVALHHTKQYEPRAPSFLERCDSGEVGIIEFDARGLVRTGNERAWELLASDPEYAIGESFEVLLGGAIDPRDLEQVILSYGDKYVGKESTRPLSFRVLDAQGGECSLLNSLALRRDEDGRVIGLTSFLVDVSDVMGRGFSGSEQHDRYQRIIEHSDALIFHTDANHTITFISRRTLDFFGLAPEAFVNSGNVRWFELIHPDDRERVEALLRETGPSGSVFDEEFRVVNRVTGQVRWLLVRLMVVRGPDGVVTGYDGFGIDITGRREAQEALASQGKKVRALYTVAASIRGVLDPSHISARGLHSLCDATGADAGLCFLFQFGSQDELKLVAHHGFSDSFHDLEKDLTNLPNLSSYVATHGHPIVVPDVRHDPRANTSLAETEGLRSALLVPISVEDEILGTIALFSHEVSRFDGGDVMLVSAASNQIGLAARQADLFAAYKRQAHHLSALYRMSHEISSTRSLDDIFSQAFSIIREELGLKRLWVGLLNESNNRLVGQAAYGPGLKRKLVEVNVALEGENNPITMAVASREPQLVGVDTASLQDLNLRKIFSRLDISSVVLVPMVAGGQVVGVLAVQPLVPLQSVEEEAVTLLKSFCAEIAGAILNQRLEERIVESDKMRTAGLLAAGIAHNFNNLLQAILGQASLLEMQSASQDKVKRASKLIHDAANKGAGLVRQLMSFAQLEQPRREACDVDFVVSSCVASAKDVAGANKEVFLELSSSESKAYVDPAQLRQIIYNVTVNALDAVNPGDSVFVSTEEIVIDDDSPHFELPYGEYVKVVIRDSGEGMDEETRKRCFEPFFTTKDVDPGSGLGLGGTGLGLAAAYALTRRNGGNLSVESRPGKGTSVSLYLPIAAQAEAAPKKTVAAASSSVASDFSLSDARREARVDDIYPEHPGLEPVAEPISLAERIERKKRERKSGGRDDSKKRNSHRTRDR